MKKTAFPVLISMLLSACGSDTATTTTTPTTPLPAKDIVPDSYGYLLDSAVAGLRYQSGEYSGVTEADGRFGYLFGENVELYIGSNPIACATPAERLTPYEFVDAGRFSTIDVLRLLQTLDDDGNPDNGIQITEAVHQLAEMLPLTPVLDLNFPPDNIDPDVILALTGVTAAGARSAVSASDACFHFAGTLDRLIDAKPDVRYPGQEEALTVARACGSGRQRHQRHKGY